MFVRIEKGSRIPISRQIAEQIRAQCLSGRLSPGVQIPSVRQLARDLAVNQNTILRVYERLASENLLDMRHGEGTFVANDLPTSELNGQRTRYLGELAQLVRHGRLLGFGAADLHALLDDALAQSHDAAVGADNADRSTHTGEKP